MRMKKAGMTFGVLTALVVLIFNEGGADPIATSVALDSGHCAGCVRNAEDSLLTFVVRTDADFDSLRANCFLERSREVLLPPKPTVEKVLLYVSLKGGGCEGCLDIVSVYETPENIAVEVTGGFRGNCDMLMIRGAWALIPRTDKRIVFRFQQVSCSDKP